MLRQPLSNVWLLDGDEADTVTLPIRADFVAGRGKVSGTLVESQRPHPAALRVGDDVSIPLEIQHETIDREMVGAQTLELLVDFPPAPITEFRDPKTECFFRRDQRVSREIHEAAPERRQIVASDEKSAKLIAPGFHFPRVPGEVPSLLVNIVEEKGVIERLIAQRVQDRKLGIPGEFPCVRNHRVPVRMSVPFSVVKAPG